MRRIPSLRWTLMVALGCGHHVPPQTPTASGDCLADGVVRCDRPPLPVSAANAPKLDVPGIVEKQPQLLGQPIARGLLEDLVRAHREHPDRLANALVRLRIGRLEPSWKMRLPGAIKLALPIATVSEKLAMWDEMRREFDDEIFKTLLLFLFLHIHREL